MKLITASLTSTILAAGLIGSVAAYRSQAGAVEDVEPTAQTEPASSDPSPTEWSWAPCPEGSQLEQDVCVFDVTRTVAVPDTSTARPARHAGGQDDDHRDGDDHGHDRDDDDHDDDHGHDRDDDHHGDHDDDDDD